MPDKKLYSLDLLRGVAALSVLMLHSGQVTGHNLMVSGYLAVDVFFALSGFVIAFSYSTKLYSGMPIKYFFLIRIIRFLPLFMLGVFLGTFATAAGIFFGEMRDVIIFDVFLSFIFSVFFLPTPGSAISSNLFPLNPPLWSLFFELIVNFLFAIIFFSLTTRRTLIIIAASFVALFVGVHLIGNGSEGFRWEAVSYGIPRVIFSFFVGVFVFRFREIFSRAPRASFFIPSIILVAALSINPGVYRPIFDTLFVAVLSPVILILSYRAEMPIQWRFLANYIGGISFCIYTIHMPLLNMAKGANRILDLNLNLVVLLTILLLLLVLSPVIMSCFDVPIRRKLLAKVSLHRN